jgi:hypothetical protein
MLSFPLYILSVWGDEIFVKKTKTKLNVTSSLCWPDFLHFKNVQVLGIIQAYRSVFFFRPCHVPFQINVICRHNKSWKKKNTRGTTGLEDEVAIPMIVYSQKWHKRSSYWYQFLYCGFKYGFGKLFYSMGGHYNHFVFDWLLSFSGKFEIYIKIIKNVRTKHWSSFKHVPIKGYRQKYGSHKRYTFCEQKVYWTIFEWIYHQFTRLSDRRSFSRNQMGLNK